MRSISQPSPLLPWLLVALAFLYILSAANVRSSHSLPVHVLPETCPLCPTTPCPDGSRAVDVFNPPQELIGLYSGCHENACVRKLALIFSAALIEILGITQSTVFLDVGCGIGRVASGLSIMYGPSPSGSYYGFDIGLPAIEWNKKAYASLPAFHFTHANIHSKYYNPAGVVRGADYQFPYPSEMFDAVFLGSVFTHDLPELVDRFLSEIHRVLKPGGCSLISWFILNEESEKFQKLGNAKPPIDKLLVSHPESGAFKVNSVEEPEIAVAYTEERMRRFYRDHHFTIKMFFPGFWSGRQRPYGYRGWDGGGGYQDAVLACKN